jgi:hypothetical protein
MNALLKAVSIQMIITGRRRQVTASPWVYPEPENRLDGYCTQAGCLLRYSLILVAMKINISQREKRRRELPLHT